jgi:NAD(P)-dependent dehydrogenase (short-subunit alcohol dehydrogenase family)
VPDPILVTGSASGIGAAVAGLLRDAGHEVVGLDLRDADVRCDLSDAAAIDAAIEQLPARLGGVASVAGVPGTHPPQRVLAVNLLAPRRLGAALLGRVAPGGAIVHVASVAAQRSARTDDEVSLVLDADDATAQDWLARVGLDGAAAYDFSKKALLALALRQAREGLATGVRALSVSPGPTETPILADFAATMGEDRMQAASQVVGRHGRAEDVAPLIAFLLSEQASWVNAVDVRVDGGLLGVR